VQIGAGKIRSDILALAGDPGVRMRYCTKQQRTLQLT